MKFIFNKNILLIISVFTLLTTMMSITPFEAHGDGLTQENLPPASVGNRQASLFIKISPPILTSDNIQDAFLQLRLFDANNNQTIQHTSFFITVTKNDKLLMRDLFHTHSGLITIKIEPTNTPGKWQVYGDQEPFQGGWTSTNDQLGVQAPILLEGGLYHFEIEVFGIDNDRNIFKVEDAPRFDSWLSVGDIYHDTLSYQTKSYDTTIISYYDKITDFKFDESKNLVSYSMPFNWDVSRFEKQNIFVHEEIHIPKSFKEFTDSLTFSAAVNEVPLVGRMLAIDPYSKEDTLILHYLINKNDILEMAKKITPDTKTMDFTLTPGLANAETATELLTDFGGFRTEFGWSPTSLKSNTKTDLSIAFFDGFSGKQIVGDVKYNLKILDKSGNVAFSMTDLNAVGAVSTQLINFPNDGIYTLEIDIKSIKTNGKTDSSRLGIARGYVVIPSTVPFTPPFTPTTETIQNTTNPNGNTSTPKSGCLIATAAFGSELVPQVQFLREYRDSTIMASAVGSSFLNAFNSIYYSFSPTVADAERNNPILQETVRLVITPLLGILQVTEISNVGGNELSVLISGILASSLVGAVYFWPVSIALKFVRKNSKPKIGLVITMISATSVVTLASIAIGNVQFMVIATAASVLSFVGTSAIFSSWIICKTVRKVSTFL